MERRAAANIYGDFLSAARRSSYLYTLGSDLDALVLCGPSGAIFPVWPTKRDAERSIERIWPGYAPFRISRASFVARLPILAMRDISVGIASGDRSTGILAPAIRLHADLIAPAVHDPSEI